MTNTISPHRSLTGNTSRFALVTWAGLTLVFLTIAMNAHACPAFVWAADLKIGSDIEREKLRLFALQTEGRVRVWKELPLQIDPMKDDGTLHLPSPNTLPKHVSPFDRLSLRIEGFGIKRAKTDALPCGAKQAFELTDAASTGRYAYLATCQQPTLLNDKTVVHDSQKFAISTKRYAYEYLPKNQLLFRNFNLINGDRTINATQNANINLRFDFKKFFTIKFENKDIQSFTNATYTGMLGAIANYKFFLKILFFNIDLSLDTTASFFEDSALIPMVFDVPREDVVHRGSGTLYWWQNGPDITWNLKSSQIPVANPKLILENPASLLADALKSCTGETCFYSIEGKVHDQDFFVDLKVPLALARTGFFPAFVPSIRDFETKMKWANHKPADVDDASGIFFDSTLTRKGLYRVEQWFRMGKRDTMPCPRPVNVARLQVEI